ncbi:hypothetical protein AB6A40_010460 [Gnathostoma spinigerum]|uniref:Uncharacterized protein n=1 Tax=Gnathostoma spinigerum TaxID=75299 RepID=A0ABD6EV46_9BILA
MRSTVYLTLLLLDLIHHVSSAFCGRHAIPYSFEVLRSGEVVLGCAQPACFGRTAEGLPIDSNASFMTIDGVSDGFLRPDSAPRSASRTQPRPHRVQEAECESSHNSLVCSEYDQWAGGVNIHSDASISGLALQCCSYAPLRQSVALGVSTVSTGQITVGGEVSSEGRLYAFDYISNLMKASTPDGRVFYNVEIRRFPCIPPFNGTYTELYGGIRDDVARSFIGGWPEKNLESTTVAPTPRFQNAIPQGLWPDSPLPFRIPDTSPGLLPQFPGIQPGFQGTTSNLNPFVTPRTPGQSPVFLYPHISAPGVFSWGVGGGTPASRASAARNLHNRIGAGKTLSTASNVGQSHSKDAETAREPSNDERPKAFQVHLEYQKHLIFDIQKWSKSISNLSNTSASTSTDRKRIGKFFTDRDSRTEAITI